MGKKQIEKGLGFFNNGAYKEAINCFDKELELDKLNTELWYYKGISLFELKFVTKAIYCFEKALEINPQYIEAWNYKGLALFDLEEDLKAIDCFNTALKLNPDYVSSLNMKGLILWYLGEAEDAIECFDKVFNIDSNNFIALYFKGHALFDLNNYENAFTCYKEALLIDPKSLELLIDLGNLYYYFNNNIEALNYYDKVLKIDSRNGLALCYKMRTLRNLNRDYEAREIDKKLNDSRIRQICLEKHLEEKLVNNLELLKVKGYDLELIRRQMGCMEGRGRMDLFCKFKNSDHKIVIELKNVEATKKTFQQIKNYVDSMNQLKKQNPPIIGLVISRGHDIEFKKLIEEHKEINYLDLKDIGFE